jgi:multiple sugar transport system substrate-binding protein
MSRLRNWSAAVTAVACAVGLVACSSSDSKTHGGTSGGSTGRQTVTFWEFSTDDPTVNAWKSVIASFEQANPNIAVNMQIVPWSEQQQKLTTAISTGGTPDISMMGNDVVAQYAAQGNLKPLDGYMAQWSKDEGKDVTSDYWPGDKLYYQYDGHYYAAPMVDETRQVLYRKDLLAKAGVDPAGIKTWDDLLNAATQIKQKVPNTIPWLAPMSKDYTTVQTFMSVYLSYGAQMLSNGKCGFDTPQFKQALEWYTDVYKNKLSTPDALTYKGADVDSAFESGQAAIIIDGPWVLAALKGKPLAAQVGSVPIPAGPKGQFGFLGGWPLIIWKGTKHADAAAVFTHYAANPTQGLKQLATVSGLLPGRKSLVQQSPWTETPLSSFVKQMDSSFPYQYPAQEIPQMGDIETETIQDAVQRVASGSASVDDSTKQLCSDINDKLGS